MLITSWNINGIRAASKKGLQDWPNLKTYGHITCFQEIKAKANQIPQELNSHRDYQFFWHPAQRPGYSGVGMAIHKKVELISVTNGLGIKKFDCEGRCQIAHCKNFILFGCYFPNGSRDHSRVDYKLEFSRAVAKKAHELKKQYNLPIIITGDYNTAHKEIDLKNPKQNINTTGFLPREREWIDQFISQGFVDLFRHQHPNEPDHYTWWTYRNNCRERNIGWRIDYFFSTVDLLPHVKKCFHRPEKLGSDHCPLSLKLSFS